MDKKEYYLYVKVKAVPVSEEVYKAYELQKRRINFLTTLDKSYQK